MARKRNDHKRTEREDGRVCVHFRFEGKQYYIYGDSTKEAEANAALAKAQLMAGTYESASARRKREREEAEAAARAAANDPLVRMPTFKEYAEEWVELKRSEKLKETTLRTNTVMVNLISGTSIGPCSFGGLLLDQVDRRDVRKLQNELSVKVSTRTTNDAISAVRSIFRQAIDDGVLHTTVNPAAKVKPVQRTEERASDTYHRALSKDETKRFLEVAATSRYYNLYVLLLHTGLRCGEACALFSTDVDDKGINVRRSVTRTEDGGYMIGSDTKTAAGRRFIPLDNEARKAIRDQQFINRSLSPSNVIPMNSTIFKAARGGILHSTIVNQDIARICSKAKVEKFTCHAFRDTFATRCVESGMEVKQLQTILGHTDVAMTLGLYAHADDDRKVEQLLAVNFT